MHAVSGKPNTGKLELREAMFDQREFRWCTAKVLFQRLGNFSGSLKDSQRSIASAANSAKTTSIAMIPSAIIGNNFVNSKCGSDRTVLQGVIDELDRIECRINEPAVRPHELTVVVFSNTGSPDRRIP